MNTSLPLLELRQLACERDGRYLFSQLSVAMQPGQGWHIVGPNGSGKTTLMRLLTGISSDYEGDIRWQGQSLSSCRYDYLNHLLYIGHQIGIKKALTPRENLQWYANMVSGHAKLSIRDALAEVALAGFEDIPCYQLSAGQLRRVALARLFFTPAPLWILDEPFTAIDKAGVAALQLLMSEHLQGGGNIILTTHQDTQLSNLTTIDLADYQPAADDFWREPAGEAF